MLLSDKIEKEEDKFKKGSKKNKSTELHGKDRDKSPDNDKPIPRRAERIAKANQPNPLGTVIFIILCVLSLAIGVSVKHCQSNENPQETTSE